MTSILVIYLIVLAIFPRHTLIVTAALVVIMGAVVALLLRLLAILAIIAVPLFALYLGFNGKGLY